MNDLAIRNVVYATIEEQQWPLGEKDRAALLNALVPLLRQEASLTPALIRRAVINYYHDGPMVDAMRVPGPTGETLWLEWRAYMVSLAHSKGIFGDAAEDLAQEAYLQTVRALANFRFGSRLKTYFCGIFLNCYRHWVRSAKRQRNHEAALPESQEGEADEEQLPWLVDGAAQPEEKVIETVDGGHVAAMIHAEIMQITKSQDFQILRWYYVEQRYVDEDGNEQKWTDETIGRILAMPLNTVTSRRLRAVRRLKNHPKLQELFAELTQ